MALIATLTGTVVPSGQLVGQYTYALVGFQQKPVVAYRYFASEPYLSRFGSSLQPEPDIQSIYLRNVVPTPDREKKPAKKNQFNISAGKATEFFALV